MSELDAPALDIEMSSDCAALLEALSAFQGDVQPPKKVASNPHFKSKFADLAEVIDAVRAPLAKHGLCLMQMPVGRCDGVVRIVTFIGHKSGQWLKGKLDMPLAQKTPQGVGSTISYARRYCLMAALGIAAEDDDGESAEGRGKGGGQAERRPTPGPSSTQARATGATGLPDLVKQLVADIAKIPSDPETLSDFYEHARSELALAKASDQQKLLVSTAFGERCRALGLNPRDVVGGRAA